jgi:hypothetical protein
MGIEPTRAVLPELENNRFGAMANPKCDQRVNCRGMWGNVRLRRGTKVLSGRLDDVRVTLKVTIGSMSRQTPLFLFYYRRLGLRT